MRKLALLAAAAFAATTLASAPAQAAAVVYTDCGGGTCFPGQTDNINIDTGSQGHIGTVLFGFSSTSDNLAAQGSGQATLVSPAPDTLINNFTFTILTPGLGFTLAELNLRDQAAGATLTITTAGGTSTTFNIDSNGANRFGVDATTFGLLTSVTLNSPGGFGTIEQIRVGGIQALTTGSVPEPGTWAMMLLGFGAAGIAMRRGRRGRALLRQIA